MPFHIQLPQLKQRWTGLFLEWLQSSWDHTCPNLQRSLSIPRHQPAVSSSWHYGFLRAATHIRACFCLNQGLTYLLAVLNWNYCDLHRMLGFFEVYAHGRVFSFLFIFFPRRVYWYLFVVRFIFRFLRSPFPTAYYYHLFMLMLSLAACIITSPFIFFPCVIYGAH